MVREGRAGVRRGGGRGRRGRGGEERRRGRGVLTEVMISFDYCLSGGRKKNGR